MFFLWANIVSGLILAIIFLLIVIFDYQNFKKEMRSIKLIVLAAYLVALAVSLELVRKIFFTSFLSYLPSSYTIKIGNFILILITFFCGLSLGFLSGIAADFLGLLFFTKGAPCLYFTLTSVIWCLLPFCLVKIFSYIYQSNWSIYLYLSLAYVLTSLLIYGVNPIMFKYLYNLKQGWWILYFPRIIKYPIGAVINIILLISCYRVCINSVRLNSKISQNKKQNPKMKIKNSQLFQKWRKIND